MNALTHVFVAFVLCCNHSALGFRRLLSWAALPTFEQTEILVVDKPYKITADQELRQFQIVQMGQPKLSDKGNIIYIPYKAILMPKQTKQPSQPSQPVKIRHYRKKKFKNKYIADTTRLSAVIANSGDDFATMKYAYTVIITKVGDEDVDEEFPQIQFFEYLLRLPSSGSTFKVDDGQTDETYELEKKIYSSESSAVYKAIQHSAKGSAAVAVKIYRYHDHSTSFIREIDAERVLREQKSDHFVRIIAHSNTEKMYLNVVIVTPFFEAGSFNQYIDKNGYIKQRNETTALRLLHSMLQVVPPLRALYERGFKHYDVKPENILVKVDDGQLTLYLADFGLADGSGDIKRRGTVPYISNVIAGVQTVDGDNPLYVDGYALGVSMVIVYKYTCQKDVVVDDKANILCRKLRDFPYTVEGREMTVDDVRGITETRIAVLKECTESYAGSSSEQAKWATFFLRLLDTQSPNMFKDYDEMMAYW